MTNICSHEFNWWQRILKILFFMTRINDDSVEFQWGYIANKFGFTLTYDLGSYFNRHHRINICIIWGHISVDLPWKTRWEERHDNPSYGIEIFGQRIWVKHGEWEGNQDTHSFWTWELPFISWCFDWHKVQTASGSWEVYELFGDNPAYQEEHPFTYTLNSGEVQERIATCYVEERQWHRKWLPLWTMNRRVIDVSFDDEVGKRTGSWKGGTVGCSYDLLKGESIESCLRRMEKERKF